MSDIPRTSNDYGHINLDNPVGFGAIPEQVREISIRKGFHFNLLVVGRRGLGSSTLINSLFAAPLVSKDRKDTMETSINEIVENDIKLRISVTTYHSDDFDHVTSHIERLYRMYFEKEQGLSCQFQDMRIHCCLFIVPGDKMTDNEISGLKELSKICNVIPVMTKADMYTEEELSVEKGKIDKIFKDNNIGFFLYNDEATYPLSTIASEKTYEHKGNIIRGRKYPWGFIDIECEHYSEFIKLQHILIYDSFFALKEKTNEVFYNTFRKGWIEKEETPSYQQKRLEGLQSQMEEILKERHEEKGKILRKELEYLSIQLEEQLTLSKDRKHFSPELEMRKKA